MGVIIDNFYREAEALKASALYNENRINNLYPIALALDNLITNKLITTEENEQLVKDIKAFVDNGLLSPLTLKSTEFDAYGINKRCKFIEKTSLGIINTKAFTVDIKKNYSETTMSEINYNCVDIHPINRIYITAGGVMTGQYFDTAYIRPSIIEKESFTVQDAVKIPCSRIIRKDSLETLCLMDKREPKFKALKAFYDISIKRDDNIKKFDIRKFKKNN